MRSDIQHQPIGNGADKVPFPFFLPRLARIECVWRMSCFGPNLRNWEAREGGRREGKVKARSRNRSQVIVCTSFFGETGLGCLPASETHFERVAEFCGLAESRRAWATEPADFCGFEP
jgi:hypothetical protein